MIYIDDREPREAGGKLARGIRYQYTRLAFGDYAWIGNGPGLKNAAFIGVERKKLRDLLNCVETGRLTGHQLIGMANAYHYLYVVIEGIWRQGSTGLIEIPKDGKKWGPLELGSRRFMVSVMDNFTNSLVQQLRVTVVFTPTLDRTCAWISNIYRWWTVKTWDKHTAVKAKNTAKAVPPLMPRVKAPLIQRVLLEFNQVGQGKAEKIAHVVGSVEGLAKVTTAELSDIDGIGETLAKSVVKELRGQ